MTRETDTPHRSLLGLRTPADTAEAAFALPAAMPIAAPVTVARAVAPQDTPTPARPDYPVVSSGWDNEDTGPASKTSDLMTAIRAGIVLLLGMVALGLLIR